jgi:hypothetical protein
MSKNRETDEQRWARLAAEEEELARLASRSLWHKIHDAESIYDLKEVLHEIVQRLDL